MAWYRTRQCGCGSCKNMPNGWKCPLAQKDSPWLWASKMEEEQDSDSEEVSELETAEV